MFYTAEREKGLLLIVIFRIIKSLLVPRRFGFIRDEEVEHFSKRTTQIEAEANCRFQFNYFSIKSRLDAVFSVKSCTVWSLPSQWITHSPKTWDCRPAA